MSYMVGKRGDSDKGPALKESRHSKYFARIIWAKFVKFAKIGMLKTKHP